MDKKAVVFREGKKVDNWSCLSHANEPHISQKSHDIAKLHDGQGAGDGGRSHALKLIVQANFYATE